MLLLQFQNQSSSMQFKSGSSLPQPPFKDSHSSDSLGYLSWLQDKINHEQSIQQTSQHLIQITSTAKKIPVNRDYSVENRKNSTGQKQIPRIYMQQLTQKKKEYQRTEDKNKKVIWDDKNSSAIASAMRCLRSKIQDLKQKLEESQELNKKLRKQNQDYLRRVNQQNDDLVNVLKCESPKKTTSIIYEQGITPIKSSPMIQKIRDYQLQIENKNTIIHQLTKLIEGQKVGAPKSSKQDEMMYIQKINLLEIQLQQMKNQSSKTANNKCQCNKLTIKYGKLLQRLSMEESRSSGYLKQSKQAQKTIDHYKNTLKELSVIVNKLPESTKIQLKRVLNKIDEIDRSNKSKESNNSKPLNKSSRTLLKSKTKESRDISSSRNNNTFRKLDMKVIQESKKSISSTPRRSKSKDKKMSATEIPKLKQSKSGGDLKQINLNKDKKKGIRQQIALLETRIVAIKNQYKHLASTIHEDPEEYETIRARLNEIALLLQQKTEQLFDKRSLLNDQ